MPRLREEHQSADPMVARGARLLRAIPAADVGDERRARLRRAMRRRPAPRGAARLWPVVVAVVIVGSVAVASAAVGVRWLQAVRRVLAPAAAPAEAGRVERARRHPRRAAGPLPAAPASSPALTAPAEPAPQSLPAAAATEARPPAKTVRPRPAPGRGAATPAGGAPGAALVMDAVTALRVDRDAVRAGRLLDRYLRLHPRGALAEPALALSVEAAQARRDPRARALAEGYLRRFPGGQFEAAARRAITPASQPLNAGAVSSH